MHVMTILRRCTISSLLAVALTAAGGCASHFAAVQPVPHDLEQVARSVPLAGRSHLKVLIVQGEDVLDCAYVKGVKTYLHSLGFNKIWLGYSHHAREFKNVIREIRCNEPQAQFVLIGYGHGAKSARDLANDLAPEGIVFELVVYLGAAHLDSDPPPRPKNAVKVLHVIGDGWIWSGNHLPGVENVLLEKTDHWDVPTHPEVLENLVLELTRIAGSIEVEVPLGSIPHFPEAPMPRRLDTPPLPEGPTPRRTEGRASTDERDEWDFLKPTAPD